MTPVEPVSQDARKRALFVVITDYAGGAERVTASLATELHARPDWNVELMVVCARLENSFMGAAVPANLRVSYGLFRSWHLAFALLPFRLLLRRYDLVFTTHIYVNALVSALRRLRLMRIGRLVMRESMSLFDRFTGLKTRIFAMLYRCYGGEDLLIAQTRYMADHVRPHLPPASVARLRAMPNPVSLSGIAASVSEPLDVETIRRLEGGRNILFCGRFVGFKRPELALEVFQRVVDEDPTLQLVYLGAGALEPDVRARTESLGLLDRVIFLGQRSNPYPIMARCEFGLLTSANEGFPNVVLEMMACGVRRIVITPCAGDLECLAGVTITETHEAEELAAALREAARSGDDRSPVYREVVASRSAAAFLERILDGGNRSAGAELLLPGEKVELGHRA